ncbi:unnamed protein product [Eruca vesicaria subsp. sativa]|uniref:NYN domain-containing protein n=1 Tax=Eruca vesicaria subsp. sativa TaxID=29727 RepID=A0ABC8IWD8_ERUVS|nr:unnamed protein product [Eruca vesicaria subsp. sativa]
MTSVTTNTTFAEAKTGVFLDVEECPIPEDLDPKSLYQNIRTALANKGYHGEVSIKAFGDRNQIPGYFESAGIEIHPVGDKRLRIREMLISFFHWLYTNKPELCNVMIISRNGMEFASALHSCKELGHNILVANPLHGPKICQCGCKTKSYDLITEMWLWETLADGGDPLVKTKREEEVSNEEEEDDVSEDLSSFTRTFSSFVCC